MSWLYSINHPYPRYTCCTVLYNTVQHFLLDIHRSPRSSLRPSGHKISAKKNSECTENFCEKNLPVLKISAEKNFEMY